MKPINRKILALVLIFLVVGDDLGIQIKAKADFVQALKSPTLQQKTDKKLNISDSDSEIQSQKHPLSTKVRRLKETETKSLAKAQTQTNDFGITFLVTAGLIILATAVNYFMGKAKEKQKFFLQAEKHEVAAEKYYQDLEEGFLISEYCLSLQSFSKLFKIHLIQERLYEEDLRQSLETLKQLNSPTPDALIKTAQNYLTKVQNSKISSTMIDECYNTYRLRQGWTETTPPSTENKEEVEKKNEEGSLNIIEKATAAATLSMTDAIKAGKFGLSGKNFEVASEFKKIVEDNQSKTETLRNANKPLGIQEYFAISGDFDETFRGLYDIYVWAFTKKEDKMLALVQGISWVCKTTHNLFKVGSDIEKLLNKKTAINLPFFSIRNNLFNCIEKFMKYKEATELENDIKNPEFEFEKTLAEMDIFDELTDFFENLITTTLKWFAPLTAGLSQFINQSLKLIAQLIHIAIAWHKMEIIDSLGKKIIEFYKNKKQKDFVTFRETLQKRHCGSVFALVKSYLQDEFAEIDQKLENSKLLLKKIQNEKPVSNYEVTDKVLTILGIICESDPENCLGFLSSKEFNLDLQTLKESGNVKVYDIAYSISKNSKYGRINSVFMLSKLFDLKFVGEREEHKFLQFYIHFSHQILIKNGYYPIFQGQSNELWGCRICGNPLYELKSITQGLSLKDINTKFHQKKAIIQESVERIDTSSKFMDSATSFFVAEYSELNKMDYSKKEYYTILPTLVEGKKFEEILELSKGADIEDIQDHDCLATCTMKSREDYSKEILKRLKKEMLSILSTIVHLGEKFGDNHQDHSFLTILFSYKKTKKQDLAKELSKKNKIYCYDISDEFFQYRHNHIALIVRRKFVGNSIEASRTISKEDFNINESILKDSGWIPFTKLLQNEIVFIEYHTFFSNQPYKFHIQVYRKEVIKLNPDPKNLPDLQNTLDLLTNQENKKNVKENPIRGLKNLFCGSCKKLFQNTPVKITRENPKLDFDFCSFNSKEFLDYIKAKAQQSVSTDVELQNKESKINICSSLREMKSEFDITLLDGIDNDEECVVMLTENKP